MKQRSMCGPVDRVGERTVMQSGKGKDGDERVKRVARGGRCLDEQAVPLLSYVWTARTAGRAVFPPLFALEKRTDAHVTRPRNRDCCGSRGGIALAMLEVRDQKEEEEAETSTAPDEPYLSHKWPSPAKGLLDARST